MNSLPPEVISRKVMASTAPVLAGISVQDLGLRKVIPSITWAEQKRVILYQKRQGRKLEMRTEVQSENSAHDIQCGKAIRFLTAESTLGLGGDSETQEHARNVAEKVFRGILYSGRTYQAYTDESVLIGSDFARNATSSGIGNDNHA